MTTSPTTEGLRAWLVARIAELRGLDPQAIDVRERFSRYGLDSLGAGQLLGGLAQLLGRPLSPTLVWEQPTIEALAGYLTGAPQESAAEAATAHEAEPIAVVGMACRFPQAPDLASYWRLLAGGVDAITEVPKGRWDAAALFDPDPRAPGKLTTRWGGFLEQIDRFDPQFFGVSPREAAQMDPQQRLALELAWEALEDAGIPPRELEGSRAGVFIGAMWTEYALLQDRAGAAAITTHSSTGGAACILANRISYTLGLQGPSLTVDTACSSSLVAVHLACQSLRSGESSVALAGGVNLMLVPETTMGFSRLGAMSPDGRSRAFDARANGYVRSEGAGLLVLKRLSIALRDGDPIYALVRGSAVNNDGASNGLTAPNPRVQQAVLRDACASAGLAPGDVHYVEAHGTGTPLGDPIEAASIGAIYGADRPADQPVLLGSAKTNVGHLEAAAGVVGLIKVALAMQHDRLPPSLHFETPSPHIDFAALRLEVVTALRPWPAPDGAPRRAGVSSFGYGGTNSHVILESPPRSIADGLLARDAAPTELRRAAWVFSGQGSQWIGMGRALVLGEPAFRAALARCDRALSPHLGWSVFEEILAGAPRALPERIDILWPTLFAFQVALVDLLRSLGAAPAAVLGHSIGEVTAAHVAGALSLDDAALVIAAQARLVQRKVGLGSMLAAAVAWDEAQRLAAASDGRVTCAIAASPVMTVLAGEPAALADLSASLAARGVFARSVHTGAAVHGPQMVFLEHELPGLLAGLSPARTEIPMISTLTGEPARGDDLDAAYWARQLHEPVRFAQSTAWLLDHGYELFLEVSPHPIVKQSIEESIQRKGAAASVIPTLTRDEDEAVALRSALDRLFVGGAPRLFDGPLAGSVHVVPVSGRTEPAMVESARNLADFVEQTAEISLADLGYTAGVRRAHHRARGVVLARDRDELRDGLRALAERREHASIRRGEAPLSEAPGVVFVFPGQGSQWLGMGRQLFAEERVFRATIEACDEAIHREAGFSIIEEIHADEARAGLDRIDVVQPLLFAIEAALAALWRSWGVEPDGVIGHSMGEVAAAHVAGILSLEDAAKVICRRSHLLRRVSGKGAMALVELSLAEAEIALNGHEDRLGVAVSNGPRSSVISGDPAAIEEVLAALEKRGVFCRRVKVDVASHSPQMDPLREDLLAALRDVHPHAAKIPMRSTVTGALVEGPELDAAYWARNLRAPVLFASAAQQLMNDGSGLFVEMSPHPVLLPALEENLAATKREGAALASLRRHTDERRTLLETLGALYVRGYPVAWAQLQRSRGRHVPLPAYPWQREPFWLDPSTDSASPAGRERRSRPGEHPLLGASFTTSLHAGERCWERALSVADLPYLADHRVQGEVVFPGAGYLEMALAAGIAANGACALEALRFERMLAVPPGAGRLVQTALTDEGAGRASVSIASRAEEEKEWTRHADAKIRPVSAAGARVSEPPTQIQRRCPEVVEGAEHYRRVAERGLPYGPLFQGVERLWLGETEALGRVRLPKELSGQAAAYWAHPALLDACFQVPLSLLPPRPAKVTYVPVSAAHARVHGRLPEHVWVHVRRATGRDVPAGASVFDLKVVDEAGQILAEIGALAFSPLDAKEASAQEAFEDCVYEVAWRLTPLSTSLPEVAAPSGAGAWLIVGDARGAGAAVAARLRARGEACVEALPGASYRRIDDQRWEVDATRSTDLERLFTEAFSQQRVCRGVVHCASLDTTSWEETRSETLQADLRRGSLAVVRIVQALLHRAGRDLPRLVLVTRGAQAVGSSAASVSVAQSPLWGLGRTLALEHPELECARVDLPTRPLAGEIDLLVRELLASDGEDQIALREEGRFAARLVHSSLDAEAAASERREPAAGRPFQLEIREPGVIERLALRELARRPPGPGEVEIEVAASGLNFLDVMKVMGVYPGLPPGPVALGSECAGTIVAVGEGVDRRAVGRAVIAAAPWSLASYVTAPAAFAVEKSARLSFEQAASIPIVFMTAYWALHHVARLARGERVLIHSASGGTGLAAIQYARSVGAEIFATAGSEEKRALLRSMGVEHVMDSRSLAFAEEILQKTGGRGVDVVLNSLTGEALTKSLEVLAPYGRFLEIGKKDIHDDRRIGLLPFRKSLSYTSIDLAGMAADRPELFASLLREVMSRFDDDTFSPLPLRVFPASAAQDAFREMAQARHTGKLVVRMIEPTAEIAARSGAVGADGSYLITGGLGGLGLTVARWLVAAGARHLALVGRSAPKEAAREAIRAMREAGAEVLVLRGDVASAADVEGMFAQIAGQMPPLRGLVHAAGVLDDRTLLDLGEEQLWTPMEPKSLGAWHLHAATRKLRLDFFVMYSSIAALLGSRGQAAYAAGNAFMDALAHARRADGLPAMSVQWSPFSEVGLAVQQENRGQRMSHQGIESFTPDEGTAILARLLDRPRAEVGLLRISMRQWLESHPQAAGMPFLRELESEQAKPRGPTIGTFREALELAAPEERATQLQDHLVQQLGRVLRLDPSRIDRRAPFTSLGVDSLMSLELRNRLEASLGLQLSAALLFTYPMPAALAEHLHSTLYPASSPAITPAVPTPPRPGGDLDDLDADELLAMLDEELSMTKKNERPT